MKSQVWRKLWNLRGRIERTSRCPLYVSKVIQPVLSVRSPTYAINSDNGYKATGVLEMGSCIAPLMAFKCTTLYPHSIAPSFCSIDWKREEFTSKVCLQVRDGGSRTLISLRASQSIF